MDPLSVHQQTRLSPDFNLTTEIGSVSAVSERGSISVFITPVLITFVVLGFIGNIIVLYAICTVRQFKRVENLMLANLSTTSIFITISTVSVYIQMTYPLSFSGPLYCKFYPGINLFMVPAEGFTMMCISLERTKGVRFPLERATKGAAIRKIGLVWSLALLLDLPRGFLFYEYNPDKDGFIKCLDRKNIFGYWVPYVIYEATNYSLTYLLPSIWLAGDWIRLVSQLRFLMACQTLPFDCEYRKRQKKLIGHAIIFTSIFIAVKVPVGTHFLLYKLPPELLSESVIEWVKTWKRFFFSAQLLHGCFYPFIIFTLSRDIRKYLFSRECDNHRRPVARL